MGAVNRGIRYVQAAIKRPGLVIAGLVLAGFVVVAVFGPALAPHSPTKPDLFHTFSPPTAAHPLGTDAAGRDVLSRTIVATRLSILMPVCVVVISSTIGSIIGVLAAAAGGWVDVVSHRAMTVLLALPGMLLGIVVVARFGSGTIAPVCAVALGTIPHIGILVRSTAREIMGRQFMLSYRLAGFGRTWIALCRGIRHLLPVIGTQSLMNVGSSLLWLAGLSFLGLGVQPPDADWGILIQDGRQAALRGQYWQALAPAVCLAAFVLATHALAEQLGHRERKRPAKSRGVRRLGREIGPGEPSQIGESSQAGELLRLDGYSLTIHDRTVISGGDLAVGPGEVVCLVGESGIGKTLLLRSLYGGLPPAANATGAELAGFGQLPGHESDADPQRLQLLRRRHIGIASQESRAGLNPMRTVGAHLIEAVVDDGLDAYTARERAVVLLADVGLGAETMREYPNRLSGGMAARVALAGALMGRPRLILADEPTAALDAVTAGEVATVLWRVCRDHGTGLLMATHDEVLASSIADRVYRVRDSMLAADEAEYTPLSLPGPMPPDRSDPTAVLSGVSKRYGTHTAVDDVSLTVGGSLGVLGRSGSGKSTLARMLVGLERPTSGRVDWVGRAPRGRRERARRAQLVWQDPDLALDSHQRIGADLDVLVRLHACSGVSGSSHLSSAELLRVVGLPDGVYRNFPNALSGGMRQRVVLARALAVRPQMLVLDEPTAQLDAGTAAGVLDVIARLQDEFGMDLVVISHDVSVISRLAERVAVMRAGRVIESGPTAAVLNNPEMEYTRELRGERVGRV